MVTRKKNAIRKERTYDVLSIQREGGNDTKILGKATSPNKQKRKKRKRKKHVWLSEGRAAASTKAQRRKTKQNKTNVTLEKKRQRICKRNARRIQVRATCGLSTRASEPARARLLWAILFLLVLPVTFGHTAACLFVVKNYGIY